MSRHKVFVSYHHANDQPYKDAFVRTFGTDCVVDRSVSDGDIPDGTSNERIRQIIRDDYIRDATVIVVLIGADTWRRKHVDWEIAAGLRSTQYNSRTGLLGLVLPSYSVGYAPTDRRLATDGMGRNYTLASDVAYGVHTIPKKLGLNVIDTNYATVRPWTTNATLMDAWIDEAFKRRMKQPDPVIGQLYSKNQSGDRWYR